MIGSQRGIAQREDNQQFRSIESLVINKGLGNSSVIDIRMLREMDSLKKKNRIKQLGSMSHQLKETNNFTAPLHGTTINLLKEALDFYHNAKTIQLLETGDYYVGYQERHLVFSQFSFGYFITKRTSINKYEGFYYRFGRYSYIGQIGILKKNLLFDGEGQLMQKKVDNTYVFMKGLWKNSELMKGIKQIYTSQNLKQSWKSSYQGTFLDMKYHGQGVLKTKSTFLDGQGVLKTKNEVFAGKFERNRYIGSS